MSLSRPVTIIYIFDPMHYRFAILVLLLLLQLAGHTQTSFRKYGIARTGVSVYFPADPGTFEKTVSTDSSDIYTGSVTTSDSLEWVCILVELNHPIDNDQKAGLLKAYLDYLKEGLEVKEAAGYGEGHTLEENPGAIGVLDYWLDMDDNVIEIKGWANRQFISVLFVAGKKEIEKNFNLTRLFLNGIRFP